MNPWGWPLLWQAWQNSTLPGVGGFPYRGASGTTNDRAFGKDIPFFWSEVDLRGYRVTSRYLAETNPFAIGFCNLLVGYHVRKGYGWQVCRKGAKKTAYPTAQTDDELVKRAQKILDTFRDREQWPVLSRECFYRWRVDGEVFLRIGQSREDGIWARVVEPEQVGAPDGSTTDPWSYGIDVREYEDGSIDPQAVLAYHVWRLESGMTLGEWVDASEIVHAKANVVLNVKRGRPDFFPVLDLFDDVRKLYTNMLKTAVDQAAVRWMEKFPSATGDQVRTLVPQQSVGNGQTVPADQSCGTWGMGWPGNQWGAWGRGGNNFLPSTVIRTEGNRQFEPGPSSNVANFESMVKLAIRAARMRWNLPGSASGDAEDTTFAAAIQAGGPFPVAVEGGQVHWGACFERPVALRVLDRAVERGELTREDRAQLDVEVTEPQIVTPEPEKDTARNKTLYDAKVLSPQTWQLKEGLDPQHERANWDEWNETQAPQPPGAPPNAPPGGAGGDGSSPDNAFADIFGESSQLSEAAPGPPPREGLVWNDSTHRWRDPDSGEEHGHPKAVEAAAALKDGDASKLAGMTRAELHATAVELNLTVGPRDSAKAVAQRLIHYASLIATAKRNMADIAAMTNKKESHDAEGGGASGCDTFLTEEHGPAPYSGAVFDTTAHRWKVPHHDAKDETGAHPALTKAKSLAARVKEVPAAVVAKVGTWVRGKYEKLSARYGPKGAKAILAACILLAPTPIPGSSLLPIALAEGVLRLSKLFGAAASESTERELSADEIEEAARELLAELEQEFGKVK